MIGWFGVPYQTLRRATSQPAGCFEEFGSGPLGAACVADRFALLGAESDHQRFGSALVVGDGWSSGAGHDPTIAQYRNVGKRVDAATSAQYIKYMNTTGIDFSTAQVGDKINFVKITRGFMPDIRHIASATIVAKTGRQLVAKTGHSQYVLRAANWYDYSVQRVSS